MKSAIRSLVLLGGLVVAAAPCWSEVDLKKEEAAIKAVLEEEKDGFFARDAARMAETWVHGPAVMKLYVGEQGETRLVGWDAISAHDKQNVASDYADPRQLKLAFSDFHIVVSGSSAWAVTKATWNGTHKGEKVDWTQARVHVLEKVKGKWKLVLMAISAIPAKPAEAAPKAP